jgi:putative spermidine/putrescine transport system permease protein
MIAPIIVLIGASFSQESHLVFPPSGFSLKWYTAFFNSKPFMNSFFISFELAVASAVTGLILGTISAYSIERSPFRNVLLSLFISPLMVPGVIISLALLRFSVTFDLVHGFWLMLIGHVIIIIPYVVRTVMASLYRYNVTLEEAAQTLGANKMQTFMHVTIPILKPGLIAAGSFAFIISFGNLSISIFLSSAKMATLPIRIFSYAEFSPDPILAAISTVTLVFTLLVMILIEKTSGLHNVC